MGFKLASLAWPGVLVVIIILAVVIAYSAHRYSMSKHNLLQLAEVNKNYYVVLDIFSDTDEVATKEIDILQKKYRKSLRIGVILFVITLLLAAIMAARPAQIVQTDEQASSRDIVLCLDVSGSTLAYDREVLTAYQSIINNFSGERIALSIFNSTTRVVFPLTNDYTLVKGKINQALKVLEPIGDGANLSAIPSSKIQELMYFLVGTTSKTDSASLIGDGLMNCSLQFDDLADQNRSRSIIFATDNILSGSPIFSLGDAATYSESINATIYGIYSGPQNMEGEENEQEMKKVIQEHSGFYFFAKNPTTVPSIITDIGKSQRSELNPETKTTILDYPQLCLYALIFTFGGYLVIVWRLRQ
ncbi:MAG: VWA domain-containing protein [Candidatus Ancillula sp.]|nr:VWA domain-containing protein [Candidatus Ancillula sp.]